VGALVGVDRAVLADPAAAPAVEQPQVAVPESAQEPERVRREPVVAIAVEDDRVVGADATLAEQLGEPLEHGRAPVVSMQVGRCDGARPDDVRGRVERRIL
jgi:hypothetical protein